MELSTLLKKDTLTVAKQLLGWELRYQSNKGPVGGIIAETEAYTQDDPACHAFNGNKTKRNAPMFNAAGHLYIYFIYGMYHCINIVTEPKGTGAAVLIRELIPTIGIDIIKTNRPKIKKESDLLNGPGKLMLGLDIPATLNNQPLLVPNCPIQLLAPTKQINHTKHPRIGLSKATDRLWRFKIIT